MNHARTALLALVLGLAGAAACGQDDDPNGAKDLYNRFNADKGFRSWRRAPGFPERKPSFTSHAEEVEIFVNPTISAALDGPNPVRSWPVGSIIVKESFSSDTPTLIAAIEKRADGWFWAEYDADGKSLFSGKPDICIDCHNNRAAYSDWVYAFEFPK